MRVGLILILRDVDLSLPKFIVRDKVIFHDGDCELIAAVGENKVLVECNLIASFFLGLGVFLLLAQSEHDVGILNKSRKYVFGEGIFIDLDEGGYQSYLY